MRIPRSPIPADDLRTAVRSALEREALLFTAGEVVVLRTILALGDDAAELYARLSLRVGTVFRVSTLAYECATEAAIAEAQAAGLLSGAASDTLALPAFPADVLRAACVRLGLPRSGARADLEDRLRGRPWREEPVVVVHHRRLLERADCLGGFDRSLAPVERIQGTIWADYEPTGGSGAFPDRRAMGLWERARRGELTAEEALTIATAGPPPWGRSPWWNAVEEVLGSSPAADVLRRIPGCAVPHVRALEAEGRLVEAVQRCREGSDDPEVQLALGRTGRRLAKRTALPWAPPPPLHEAPVRKVWLERASSVTAPRPLWRVEEGSEPVPVEEACLSRLAAAGRTALHSENWLWTSLFALVFRELYWLPVPGTLPTTRRAGPLDLGTPAFFAARADKALSVLSRLRAQGLAPFVAAWKGERLDGLVNAQRAIEVGAALDGPFIAVVLERILRLGWAAARGLPDLLVLPGPANPLFDALPSTLPESAFFAEIKGPGDSLREGQRLWHHSLREADIFVEVWVVETAI